MLLPALRSADADAVVLADGFSCRTQIGQGDSGGREAVHLAELLAALHGDPAVPGERPEVAYAVRPSTSRASSWAALAGVAAGVAGAAWAGVRARSAGRRSAA